MRQALPLLLLCTFVVWYAHSVPLDKRSGKTGTIEDMEHIVIFMQENRAFDHYYGVLNGIRGFNDRAHPPLPNGRPIFYQPAGDGYILPFHLQFNKTSTQCMPAPAMEYESDINIFHEGRMDAWNTARDPGFGMSYFTRTDLPYYYALADSFTIADQYYQSTFTATNPNRLFLFTGTNGLSVPESGYCMLDDTEYNPGFKWETMAETLDKANVTWRVIQEEDNFDDNAFEWMEVFQRAKAGESLYEKGVRPVKDLVGAFNDMVSTDSLPSVLWIVGPTRLSEHAENHPGDGEDLTARLLSVLAKPEHAGVYGKTAFILNYDEGGQFVDHHWTPTPPRTADEGHSTVDTTGELTLKEEFNIPPGNPIGLGFRVPMMIISPWTRGHLVYSEVSDHASVVKLVEKRFGVQCPNMSPWRRAVVGDLTAAFDFTAPDLSWPTLPNTSQNVNMSKWECDHLPSPTLPTEQRMPTQEPGTRVLRPLPYKLLVSDSVGGPKPDSLSVKMDNSGTSGAVFIVFDGEQPDSTPLKFTIEGGKDVSHAFAIDPSTGAYNQTLYGPNGFVRGFMGIASDAAVVHSALSYHESSNEIQLSIFIEGDGDSCDFTLTDNAYGMGQRKLSVALGHEQVGVLSTAHSANWYDMWLSLVPSASCPITSFQRRFMGHMETQLPSQSDPAMATGKSPFPQPDHYEPVPEEYRVVEKWTYAKNCASRRSRMKDSCWTPEEDRQMRERAYREEL